MPIKISTERINQTGSLAGYVKSVKLGIVGATSGETKNVTNEAVNFSGSGIDALQSTNVSNILKISENPNDFINIFTKNVDYSLYSTNGVEWLNTPLGIPSLEISLASGGTGLGTSTYNYKIIALREDKTTAASSAVSVTGTSSTSAHVLNWTKVPFADGYVIYDSTANRKIADITSGNITQYIRTTASGVPATIPSTGNAVRTPKDLVDYFVDYQYKKYDYTPHNFTSLSDIYKKYGIGSTIGNMARILFQEIGIPELYVVAANGSNNQAYLDAIDKFEAIDDINYMTVLNSNSAVLQYIVNKAFQLSQTALAKERFAVVSVPNTYTELGDGSQSSHILYQVEQYAGQKRAIVVVPNGNKIYMNNLYDDNGNVLENQLVYNYYLAGAVAGIMVTAPDVATSIISYLINGFNFGPNGAPWTDSTEKNKVEASGGLYVQNNNGRFQIYNDNTNDTSSTENSERSILSAEDELRRRLRKEHQSYLGRKINNGLIQAIYKKTSDVIKQMIKDQLINSWDDTTLEVKQDDVSKTTVIVTFSYRPIYPLKELKFQYSFDLSNS